MIIKLSRLSIVIKIMDQIKKTLCRYIDYIYFWVVTKFETSNHIILLSVERKRKKLSIYNASVLITKGP